MKLISVYAVRHTNTTSQLHSFVGTAAYERNIELDSSMTYAEQADFLKEEAAKEGDDGATMFELAAILEAAEEKLLELGVVS